MSTQIIDEHDEAVRTEVPIWVDSEDPLFVFYEISLSLRQLLLLLATGFAWIVPAMLTAAVVPFLPMLLSLLLWSWIFIGGLWLTFWRKQGLPVEYYVTDLVLFRFSEQKLYLPVDDSNGLLSDRPYWSLVS